MKNNRLILSIIFPVVFASGALVGWSANSLILKERAARFVARGPEGGHAALLDRYANDLELSDEQRDKMELLLARYEVQMTELRQKHRHEIDNLITQRRKDAHAFLSDDQFASLEKSDEEAKKRAERFGPGGPPPPGGMPPQHMGGPGGQFGEERGRPFQDEGRRPSPPRGGDMGEHMGLDGEQPPHQRPPGGQGFFQGERGHRPGPPGGSPQNPDERRPPPPHE